MRMITLSLLALILSAAVAEADRYDRRDRRDDRRGYRAVRDNRTYSRPIVRNGYRRQRYAGPIRANRRVIDRRPIYVNNGAYVFHGGQRVVYRRPVIARRYYDVRVRPQVIVENYPSQNGYIWVSGNWSWNGGEWIWTGGHYAPDPSFTQFYDDGSYDLDASYDVNVQVGGGY